MKLSVVVVVFDMPRAAPRTLHALSAAYQRDIAPEDYEVIVVENGSRRPLSREAVEGLEGSFRYVPIRGASPSPAPAVNLGLSLAEGELLGVLIDGARIVTPGLLARARRAAATHPRAVVASCGWTLGHVPQNQATADGFDEATEDALLASIGWPRDPYRLFEIASLDGSSALLGPIAESNTLFMRRELWDELGGMDERFDQPGGGLVNLDLLERATACPGAELILLLGEASFHQIHGGISTNSLPHQLADDLDKWHIHYQNLRRHPWRLPDVPITYYGTMPEAWRTRLVEWANQQTLQRLPRLQGELLRLQQRAEAAETRAAAAEARADAASARALEAEERLRRSATAPLPVRRRRLRGAAARARRLAASLRRAREAAP